MLSRITSIKIGLTLVALIILTRLFYWQVLSSDQLSALAQTQRSSIRLIPAERGRILTSDGYDIVTNQPTYLLYAYKPQLQLEPAAIATQIAPITLNTDDLDATESAKPHQLRVTEEITSLIDKLSHPQRSWIALARKLPKTKKEQIQALEIEGLGFDNHTIRYYPEASSSAHLLGFVGQDQDGQPQGYFGLEGYYNLELKGKTGLVRQERDPNGQPIIIGDYSKTQSRAGRDLKLHIDRSLQHIVETKLKDGLEKYEASGGEVVIMDPENGAILAMASLPSYDPAKFFDYESLLYKNPSVASSFEPGSTFKVLTMAAGIDAGVVEPDTKCDSTCDGPVKINEYTIKTWNEEYNPGLTMTEVLENSDNTGMIYVVNKLGRDRFLKYLDRFGIGRLTGIDLQEETTPNLKSRWSEVDLATGSFGQGIATTSMQMVRAVAAIANGGNLVTPRVVSEVVGERTVPIKPEIERGIISKEAAEKTTQMMVSAVENGNAYWRRPKGYTIAGKTGTAQIPVAGHYDEDRTIASFVGFAPAYNPRFVMLVKLNEPQTSTWGSETAAPLWFDIAGDVLVHLNIPPQK